VCVYYVAESCHALSRKFFFIPHDMNKKSVIQHESILEHERCKQTRCFVRETSENMMARYRATSRKRFTSKMPLPRRDVYGITESKLRCVSETIRNDKSIEESVQTFIPRSRDVCICNLRSDVVPWMKDLPR